MAVSVPFLVFGHREFLSIERFFSQQAEMLVKNENFPEILAICRTPTFAGWA
jgi:hypothetical protein